jgi:hypothetical protein
MGFLDGFFNPSPKPANNSGVERQAPLESNAFADPKQHGRERFNAEINKLSGEPKGADGQETLATKLKAMEGALKPPRAAVDLTGRNEEAFVWAVMGSFSQFEKRSEILEGMRTAIEGDRVRFPMSEAARQRSVKDLHDAIQFLHDSHDDQSPKAKQPSWLD